MNSDLEIARSVPLRSIPEVAERAGIPELLVEPHGRHMAKIRLEPRALEPRAGVRVIGVTSINATPYGEGKTVTAIALVDALHRMGKSAIGTLRQPSLGPIFGTKGGATGGGRAQVVPGEDINLHFTGDLHAVSAAHNLLAAMADNHVFHGNRLDLVPREMLCTRTVDMNDRSLRDVILGIGLTPLGATREGAFDIVAASEVMAALTLATDLMDLKARLARMVVGFARDGRPVTAADLRAQGAMTVLLKDAVKPNLVQTLEGSPMLVHAGPFANVAPGNSSVVADRLARSLCDYVVTESGFGSECGFEKLVDLKCRHAGYQPNVAVLVVSTRALKWHGGALANPADREQARKPAPEAVRLGAANLAKHVDNVRAFGCPCVVAINVFESDSEDELRVVEQEGHRAGATAVVRSAGHARGGAGAQELAGAVLRALEHPAHVEPLYPLEWSLREKIHAVATKMFGARDVRYSAVARGRLDFYESHGYGGLPVCIAKTSSSLSHDPHLKNRPEGFTFPIEDARLYAGAGYVLPLAGKVLTMPGLPEVPAAEGIDIDAEGRIRGL